MRTPHIALLLAVGCNGNPDDTDDSEARDPRFDGVAEAIEAHLPSSGATAMSIAIYEGGEVVWAEAFGPTRVDGDTPATASTLFQLGSTTKVFTSLALLQDVEAGRYALDDSLTELLPELEPPAAQADWWGQLTPHRLLSNQSGLIDHVVWDESNSGSLAGFAYDTYPDNAGFMNRPGAFWNYSNPGFSYAGLVVEEHATELFPAVMASRVFAPLGMSRTTQERDDVAADGDYALGHGYVVTPQGSTRETDITSLDQVPHAPFSVPAGVSTWSTPTEVLRLADFLIHGDPEILSDALRAEMMTAHLSLLSTPDDSGYGYGLFVRPGFNLPDGYHASPLLEHGGNTLQYSSALYILPEQDFAVSILSSGVGTDFGPVVVPALQLAEGLAPAQTAPGFTIDTDRFVDHTGSFDGTANIGPMEVALDDDGNLEWTLPLLDQYGYDYEPALSAVSSTLFIGEVDGQQVELTFIDDGDTTSRWLRNRSFVGTRAEAPVALQPAPFLPARPTLSARIPRRDLRP